jgi:di/tricarboxylate transporter
MPADAWVTLAVLAATVIVLIIDRFPVVLVMGGAVAVLLLGGVIDEDIALSGFASSAPLTIAGLYVVAGAAAATGALGGTVDRVLGRAGNGLLRLGASTAAISAVVPNTPLVAVLAPRVMRWSRRTGEPASRYLMPLSYASVLGGVITLIGTSTNLVVSDVLRASGHEPLDVFEMTPVGLPVAAVGVCLLTLIAPRLLRDREAAGESMRATARRFHVVMTVEDGGPLVGATVAAAGLRSLDGVYLAAVERRGSIVAAHPDLDLEPGDQCFFVGDIGRVLDLQHITGLASAEQSHLLDTERPGAQLFEAVVSQQSTLVGQTLREAGFRARYDAAVLAVHRPDGDVTGKLGSIDLRPGDVLLLLANPSFEPIWRNHSDFSLVAAVDEEPPPRRRRAWLPSVVLLAMIVTATVEVLSLFEASMLAAAAVVAGGAISVGEARRAINLNVVLTIAVSVSLGAAVETSGLAAEIAAAIADVGEPFGDVGILVAVLVATMVLTELVSNNAAAALMLPVGLGVAAAADIDARALAVAVLIGASCSFLSPVGYQTNLMVYGLGGYRFADFTRVGAPITLSTIVVATAALWAFML